MKIAVLGAPGSGHAVLAEELTQHFRATQSKAGQVQMNGTPALLAAIHADLFQSDASLYASAVAQHKIYDLTILIGLDTPCSIDMHQAQASDSPAVFDARLRTVLTHSRIAYAVIYGQGPARMEAALNAISALSGNQSVSKPPRHSHWQWTCEKCSDSGCEHRMFTDQLKTSR